MMTVMTDPNAQAVSNAAIEVLVHAADDPTNKKELTRFNGVERLIDLMEQTNHLQPAGDLIPTDIVLIQPTSF